MTTTISVVKPVGEIRLEPGSLATIPHVIKSNTSPTFPEIDVIEIIPTTISRSWVVGNLQALEEFESMFV